MTTGPTTDSSMVQISAAARAAGVSKQTVEYYIMLGLVDPLRRGEHQRRYFDTDLIKRIRLIRQLNESGYTLRSIREIHLRRR